MLRREGITQGDPLSMILYGITLDTIVEELCVVAPDSLELLYANDVAFSGPVDRSARLMELLLEWGLARGYFPEPVKSIFICDSSYQEETVK